MADSTRLRLDQHFPPVSYEQWLEVVQRDLKGASFDKRLVSQTDGGIRVEPLYAASDQPAVDVSGFPGLPPYTRGSRTVPGSWDVRQRVTHPDAYEAAKQIETALQRGAHSLWIELDRKDRAGRDWDHVGDLPAAVPNGVMLSRVDQLHELLSAVDLSTTPVVLDAGASALPVVALLVALATRRGIDLNALQGTLSCDPLGALAADGRLPTSLERCYRQMADIAAWTDRNASSLSSVTVSTLPYHDAGATATQELAFALASGVEYLRRLCDTDLTLGQACGQLSFRLAVGRDVFIEMAKLRAIRLTWARVVQACGGEGKQQALCMHVCTSHRTKTRCDPWVNMLRSTAEGFAAAAAGADAVTISPFDEAVGPADDFSLRIARNTQTILDEEARLGAVADPAGGSWYVESLTRSLAEAAWSLFQRIEGAGGMSPALIGGKVAQWIAEAADQRRQHITKRKMPITGVSAYPNVHEEPQQRRSLDVTVVRQRVQEELAQHLTTVDQQEATAPLARVCSAETTAPGALTEAACLAASNGATFGRIAELLNSPEKPLEIEALKRHRDAEPFEDLRAESTAFADISGHRPKVFLANMGPIPQHRARAEFTSNFLQAGGIDPIESDGFSDVETAVRAFTAAKAPAAVICSTDEDYAERAPQLAKLLKEHGARFIVLAGRPGENEQRFRDAGIDHFIYLGCDVYQTLRTLLEQLEVVQW